MLDVDKIRNGRRLNKMDCPWYLGFQATEECLKTCTITEENRDYSICPESTSEDDAYMDMAQIRG